MILTITNNKAAADYLRGKAAMHPGTFARLPAEIRARAFTIGAVTDVDLLRDLQDRVAELPEGGDWREIRKTLAAEISPFLEETEDGRPGKAAKARAELVLRTAGFQAYASARHAQQTATAGALPYWQYFTVGDANVRPEHKALDGKVLPADDPFWKTHYPPWDFGCRCIVVAITAEEAGEIRDEDADKEPAERRVIEGDRLDELHAGTLDLGLRGKLDMRAPAERTGDPLAYSFSPARPGPDLAAIRARYTPEIWQVFERLMRSATVRTPDGNDVSVWSFVVGADKDSEQ